MNDNNVVDMESRRNSKKQKEAAKDVKIRKKSIEDALSKYGHFKGLQATIKRREKEEKNEL
jgi:hypothetical protein